MALQGIRRLRPGPVLSGQFVRRLGEVSALARPSAPIAMSSLGGAMRRRTFDRLVSTEGLVLVPVLAVAGGMLSWARRYITGEIRD